MGAGGRVWQDRQEPHASILRLPGILQKANANEANRLVRRGKRQTEEKSELQSCLVHLGLEHERAATIAYGPTPNKEQTNIANTVANDGLASTHAVAAIKLLLLTGARRGDILALNWENVDFDSSQLALSDSKTGPMRRRKSEVLGVGEH